MVSGFEIPAAHNAAIGALRDRALPGLDTQALARSKNPEAIRKAAEEFEAVYIAQMLAPVFSTVETDGLFGGGPSEEVYRSLLVEEYGKTIARAGGLGIADHVQREILALQEALSS